MCMSVDNFIKDKIESEKEKNAVDSIETYYKTLEISNTNTFHQYEKDFPCELTSGIVDIKYGTIMQTILGKIDCEKYAIETIDNMNELYIASMGANGSDKVFETDHIDGPFWYFPFCTVYRVVLGLSKNRYVKTCFPYDKYETRVDKYDFVGFDYNRTIHSVKCICDVDNGREDLLPDANEPRIVYKLHYITYWNSLPRWLVVMYKALHVKYNSWMRKMFLMSQLPRDERNKWNPCARFMATIINTGTVLYSSLAAFSKI